MIHPVEAKAELAAAIAATIREESEHVPFVAVCGHWGHQRLMAVARTVDAELAKESEEAADAFWAACGFPTDTPRRA